MTEHTDRNVITRAQYMDHTHPATHRDYFGSIAEELAFRIPETLMDRVRASEDEHYNDIPLRVWDMQYLPNARSALSARGDFLSAAGKVCILKEQARRQIEEEEGIRGPQGEGRSEDGMSYTRELLLKIAAENPYCAGLVLVCDRCGCPEIQGEERAWFDANSGELDRNSETGEREAIWCPRCDSSEVWYDNVNTNDEAELVAWEKLQTEGVTP